MNKSRIGVRMARISIIAGVYIALTAVGGAWSYGPIQLRVSDALVVLPFLDKIGFDAMIGILIGGSFANLFGPFGIIDFVFGLIGGLIVEPLYYFMGKWKRNAWTLTLASVISSIYIALWIGYCELHLVFGAPEWVVWSILASELLVLVAGGYLIYKFAERLGL
ncbi:MAG: QueT transporter family protein [Thermofilum sp.]|uniref:QueT transporter family protein n=1 Tax=Thermofilum sp. TaxID=1961369 RepID=UPI00316572DD